MNDIRDKWYVSFEEFRENETIMYIINILVIPYVTSYPELSIFYVVDWFSISINLYVNDKIIWPGEISQG